MGDIWSTAYSRPSMVYRNDGTTTPNPAMLDYLRQAGAGALPGTAGVIASTISGGSQDAAAAYKGISTFYPSSDGDPFHHAGVPGYR